MALRPLSLVCALFTLLPCGSKAADRKAGRQYCIVGAGPAGIQLGHFLLHAKRDYVIFERNRRAGSFFELFPRHRRLISLNKRSVREGRSAEFALRHDWNSLLDVRAEGNRTRPVTQRSRDLFPHADVLAEYIVDFADEQRDAIQYETEVSRIRRAGDGIGFLLEIRRSSGALSNAESGASAAQLEAVHCSELIVATGLWKPRGVMARVDGAAYVEGYEDLPETGEDFEGKSVVVLGLGNAALETAQELQKYAAEVHVFARPRTLPGGGSGVRFAYQTHYVGDIRAGRTTILDTYLLKSLDTLDFTALAGQTRMVVLPCQGMRKCIWSVDKTDCADKRCKAEFSKAGQHLDYNLPVAFWAEGSHVGRKVREILSEHAPLEEGHGWVIANRSLNADDDDDMPLEDDEAKESERRRKLGIDEEVFSGAYSELSVRSSLLRRSPALLDALVPIRARSSGDNARYPLDHIIRCFGWAMDKSIFDSSIALNTTHNGKYPQLLPTFESADMPGLYFAGTLSHGRDFRRSAGGFVHGFRYTARALFRLLEQRNFGVPWPATVVPLRAGGAAAHGIRELTELLLRRINEASGPYQMFGSLADVTLLEREESGNWAARYLEELPLEYALEEFRHLPRLLWVFRYGKDFHGQAVLGEMRVGSTSSATAEKSNFLHPQISFFPAGEVEPSKRHWIHEDIFTSWNSDETRVPLARFVARAVAAATKDATVLSDAEALVRDLEDGEAWCLSPQCQEQAIGGVTAQE